jgi:Leucine-rich repeat (LRR) protein
MKNTFILYTLLFCVSLINAQTIKIPDSAFKRELLTQGIDENGDGTIQKNEALKVTKLYVSKQGIKSLDGIEQFTNLIEFGCHYNEIKNLDLKTLKKLQFLYAFNNLLESININGLTELKHIHIHNNPNLVVNIDLLQFKNLEELQIENNRISKLNLKNLKNLKFVNAENTRLIEIQIEGCDNLEQLWLSKNQLISVDFKPLTKIEYISLSYNPVKHIDIRQLKGLKKISCLDCYHLKQINTSGCENLEPILW